MLGVLGAIVLVGLATLWLSKKVGGGGGGRRGKSTSTRGGGRRDGGAKEYRHLVYNDCPPKSFQNRTRTLDNEGVVIEVEIDNLQVFQVPPGEIMTVNLPVHCIEFRTGGHIIDRFDYTGLADYPATWVICPPVLGVPEGSRYTVTYLEGQRGELLDFQCPAPLVHPTLYTPRPQTYRPPVRLPAPPTPLECPYHVKHPLPPLPPLPPVPPPPAPVELRSFLIHIAFDKSNCPPETQLDSVKVRYSTNSSNGIYELGDLREAEFLEKTVELGDDIELIFDEHGDRPGEELSRERFPLPPYCPDRRIHVIFGCRPDSEGWHVLSFETS